MSPVKDELFARQIRLEIRRRFVVFRIPTRLRETGNIGSERWVALLKLILLTIIYAKDNLIFKYLMLLFVKLLCDHKIQCDMKSNALKTWMKTPNNYTDG